MNVALLSKCVYPLTSSLMNEKYLLTAFYKSTNSIPNFYAIKLILKDSIELKPYKVSDDIVNSITIIENYKYNFFPHMFDRFLFEKNGVKLFSLINIDTNQDRRATLINL